MTIHIERIILAGRGQLKPSARLQSVRTVPCSVSQWDLVADGFEPATLRIQVRFLNHRETATPFQRFDKTAIGLRCSLLAKADVRECCDQTVVTDNRGLGQS